MVDCLDGEIQTVGGGELGVLGVFMVVAARPSQRRIMTRRIMMAAAKMVKAEAGC
tara:strand:+ start:658 stop:822 length:165 start_codon:yes stop_codon:yes gene_type:complete